MKKRSAPLSRVCLSAAGLLALCTVAAVAGSHSAESPAITVDTRDSGNRPIVQDVTSRYCSGQQHVYFLHGVSLDVEFKASVNWNGKSPGTVRFNEAAQAWPDTTRTYDVGSAFGVGGKMEVVAVASDGTESTPFRVNFDIAPIPIGIPAGIINKDNTAALQYRVLGHVFDVLRILDCGAIDVGDEGFNLCIKGDDGGKGDPLFGGSPFQLDAQLADHIL